MTFQRIQALCDLINRYKSYLLSFKCPYPDDKVVVFISFDILNELRAKCVHKMWLKENGDEFFMGCQVIIDLAPDYMAVAYMGKANGQYHDVKSITEEDMS